jgi:hypothetical protein
VGVEADIQGMQPLWEGTSRPLEELFGISFQDVFRELPAPVQAFVQIHIGQRRFNAIGRRLPDADVSLDELISVLERLALKARQNPALIEAFRIMVRIFHHSMNVTNDMIRAAVTDLNRLL